MKQDFVAIVKNLVEENKADKSESLNLESIFSKKWPSVADKIVSNSKKKRLKEIKEFLTTHDEVVRKGKISILKIYILNFHKLSSI